MKSEMNLMRRLWNDEQGAVLSIELILISTIAVIGLIVGLATYRNSVTQEIGDAAMAIGVLSQSYSYTTTLPANPQTFGNSTPGLGVTPRVSITVSVGDSTYTDTRDYCEPATPDAAGDPPGCLEISGAGVAPIDEGTQPAAGT